MDASLVPATASEVRALIARLIIAETAHSRQLGEISLAPHQVEAVSRINASLREFRGAFLCDAVGSGKTYIGLAVAGEMKEPLVIAPAALRDMWMTAMKVARCTARFISVEALSYRVPDIEACGGIVVDEAHHFRNRNTKRYHALARLAKDHRVLLMTATPIHNSRRDFENLAAIFLGARARHLSAHDMTRLIVRRERARVRVTMPVVRPPVWLDVGDDPATVAAIRRLPPPIPLRDAGEADALLALGLIRQWASSEAALIAALKRRRARAAAFESALEGGEHPTREDLRSWILGEDAIQLQLPDLFAASHDGGHESLLRAVRVHSAALAGLSHSLPARNFLDDQRLRLLRQIRMEHPSARIVAFASYEATVVALFERLLGSDRVACLTSRGARVAGGRITRSDAIKQFDPACRTTRESDRIDLLLTTDLLSEGVNLQNANVVVHLDVPWTAARLEQRIGRAARAGSPHGSVAVFGFKPPASAERALRASAIVQSKFSAAASTIGADHNPGLRDDCGKHEALPEMHEALREVLVAWLARTATPNPVNTTLVAAVECDRAGFLAVLEDHARSFLLCDAGGGSVEPSDLLNAAMRACGRDVPLDREGCEHALSQIKEWLSNSLSADAAGLTEGPFLRGRRKIFARINSFVFASAPHARFQRELLTGRVRNVASATLGAEEERVLGEIELANDASSQEEWFAHNLISAKPILAEPHERNDHRIRALLLLVPGPARAS